MTVWEKVVQGMAVHVMAVPGKVVLVKVCTASW